MILKRISCKSSKSSFFIKDLTSCKCSKSSFFIKLTSEFQTIGFLA